jgi:hypothetical protein
MTMQRESSRWTLIASLLPQSRKTDRQTKWQGVLVNPKYVRARVDCVLRKSQKVGKAASERRLGMQEWLSFIMHMCRAGEVL